MSRVIHTPQAPVDTVLAVPGLPAPADHVTAAGGVVLRTWTWSADAAVREHR